MVTCLPLSALQEFHTIASTLGRVAAAARPPAALERPRVLFTELTGEREIEVDDVPLLPGFKADLQVWAPGQENWMSYEQFKIQWALPA